MKYLENSKTFELKNANINRRDVGMLVRFMYDGELKHAIILDVAYEGKMHAIKLYDDLSVTNLKKLLTEIDENDNYDILVNRYMNAPYTPDRAYRTYLLNKMRNVQRIALKE
jgi:hypothetical protein